MIRFTAIRLLEIAAVLVLMSFVIYALIGLMPGDPIDLMTAADPASDRRRCGAAEERSTASTGRSSSATSPGPGRRSAAISAIRGCSPRRCGRRCCRGSAIPRC